jgi:hypothetical protein
MKTMNIKGYKTLIEAIEDLRNRGFKANLTLIDQRLKNKVTDHFFTAKEMCLVEIHRFKEQSKAANFSIIFAVFCNDGTKGLVISTGATRSNMNLIRFMDKVKIMTQSELSKAA